VRALYVTHPQVLIDASVPVPQWGLSPQGRARAQAFADRDIVPTGAAIFASDERKAIELATLLSPDRDIRIDPSLGENDRSATGFLPSAEFEAMADRFFGEPATSAQGWERAIDAQMRIVAAVARALAETGADRPVVFCGHGGVGTLLKCHVSGRAIARAEDQSRHAHPGGGNCFAFDLEPAKLAAEWVAMEDFAPGWFSPSVAAAR
jgi:broad specificity phosphatase PhoE|tara:strand:- start:35095 stop:35715 length:621 start_codon:yes stop_codon:yes gene_type:complete